MSTATAVLKDFGISKRGALREFALLSASQELDELRQECSAFRAKYNMAFAEFAEKLQSSTEEIFAENDDYLAWKFAEEGIAYWQAKIEQLK